MITKLSKKVLKRYQKKIDKHYGKMLKIVNEMKDDGMYVSLAVEYADRDLNSLYNWLYDAIKTKKSFAQRYGAEYNAAIKMDDLEKMCEEDPE